ncbi:MAG: hypothetical protein ACYDAG_13360 [Chloroflexota bacterium]
MGDLERLVLELLDAWDAWIDADAWSGDELDALADVVKRLREQLGKDEG